MNAVELLNDMRRLQKSVNTKRIRRKNESRDDYIKRKANYRCAYCHKIFHKKQLNTSLEPYHIVKPRETLNDILTYYRINQEHLLNLNFDIKLEDIQTGTLLKVPEYFKIFPNTHGICFCDKCGGYRLALGFDHVSFIKYLLKKRRSIRDDITPELRRKVYLRDGFKCVYCEIEYGKTKPNTYFTLDHKNPVVGLGKSNEENLCTSCGYHNLDKDRDTYEQYIQKIKKRRFLRENGMIS